MNQFNTGTALDALCSLAMANVIEHIDDELCQDYAFDAHQQAQCLGYYSPHEDMLVLFRHEPMLQKSFRDGQSAAKSYEEMERCAECQSSNGDPCRTHG